MPTVLLLEATFDIAQEEYLAQLAARNTASLESLVSNLITRFEVAASVHSFDTPRPEIH